MRFLCHFCASNPEPFVGAPLICIWRIATIWTGRSPTRANHMTSETKHLVCAQCVATNRVPIERLQDGPICGRCKSPLLPASPIALNRENFQKFTTVNAVPVVVDFWAPWCQPCKAMGPHFAQAATELQGNVILAKLDTEAFPEPAQPLRISGIPTMILFERGVEKSRTSGAMGSDDIVNWIQTAISG